MISVRHLDDGVASSELVAQTHDLCQQKPIIVVAEYPSIGLASIIQYVHGFVFERCPLLCHLAIILRERGIPAIVVANARSRISTGDSLQIGPDGLSVMPSLMTGTGGRSEEGVQ
jgi:phosphoenolpyruvate-protein kinase (PTS system EI component)